MAVVLGFDTETTGLNTKNDYIIEVGAALYDTQTRQMVDIFDALILWPSRPRIDPEALHVHGISQDILEKWGTPAEEVFTKLFMLAEKADYMCGHNVLKFDKPMLDTALLRIHDRDRILYRKLGELKWIDTMFDLPYPKYLKIRKLELLAAHHRYYNQHSHRAFFDVCACLHLLGCYDFNHVLEINATPLVEIKAEVPYEQREDARINGFYWYPEKKSWLKFFRKYHLDETKKQLNFPISIQSEEFTERLFPQEEPQQSQLSLQPQ